MLSAIHFDSFPRIRGIAYRLSTKMSPAQSPPCRMARPAHVSQPLINQDNALHSAPMLWLTAFIAMFSYSSIAGPRPPAQASGIVFRLTYFIRSWSSGDFRFGKGRPTITTARARSSVKFKPAAELESDTTAVRQVRCNSAYPRLAWRRRLRT